MHFICVPFTGVPAELSGTLDFLIKYFRGICAKNKTFKWQQFAFLRSSKQVKYRRQLQVYI